MDIFAKNLIHNSDLLVQDKKILSEDLDRILESARWAPSPFNSQPWEFIIFVDEAIKNEVVKISKDTEAELILSKSPLSFAILYNTTRMDPGENADKLGLMCLGACINNIFLSASAQNIKINPFFFNSKIKNFRASLKQLLKIPAYIELMAIFGLSYLKNSSELKIQLNEIQQNINSYIYQNKFNEQSKLKNIESNFYSDDVFKLIKRRKSYRKKFLKKEITQEHESLMIKPVFCLPFLASSALYPWRLILIKDKKIINKFADLIYESANKLYMDDFYYKKMIAWIRFSDNDINVKADGIFIYAFFHYMSFAFKVGTKLVELPFFKMFKKRMIKSFSKSFFHDLVETSPLLIGLVYDNSNKNESREEYEIDMLNLGTALQNILLSATSLDIGAQFLSILLDTKETKQKVKEELQLPSNFDIVDMIRVGYIDKTASPPQYLTVQSNIRRHQSELFHKNYYGK